MNQLTLFLVFIQFYYDLSLIIDLFAGICKQLSEHVNLAGLCLSASLHETVRSTVVLWLIVHLLRYRSSQLPEFPPGD